MKKIAVSFLIYSLFISQGFSANYHYTSGKISEKSRVLLQKKTLVNSIEKKEEHLSNFQSIVKQMSEKYDTQYPMAKKLAKIPNYLSSGAGLTVGLVGFAAAVVAAPVAGTAATVLAGIGLFGAVSGFVGSLIEDTADYRKDQSEHHANIIMASNFDKMSDVEMKHLIELSKLDPETAEKEIFMYMKEKDFQINQDIPSEYQEQAKNNYDRVLTKAALKMILEARKEFNESTDKIKQNLKENSAKNLENTSRITNLEEYITNGELELQITGVVTSIVAEATENVINNSAREFKKVEKSLQILKDNLGENHHLLKDIDYKVDFIANFSFNRASATERFKYLEGIKNNPEQYGKLNTKEKKALNSQLDLYKQVAEIDNTVGVLKNNASEVLNIANNLSIIFGGESFGKTQQIFSKAYNVIGNLQGVLTNYATGNYLGMISGLSNIAGGLFGKKGPDVSAQRHEQIMKSFESVLENQRKIMISLSEISKFLEESHKETMAKLYDIEKDLFLLTTLFDKAIFKDIESCEQFFAGKKSITNVGMLFSDVKDYASLKRYFHNPAKIMAYQKCFNGLYDVLALDEFGSVLLELKPSHLSTDRSEYSIQQKEAINSFLGKTYRPTFYAHRFINKSRHELVDILLTAPRDFDSLVKLNNSLEEEFEYDSHQIDILDSVYDHLDSPLNAQRVQQIGEYLLKSIPVLELAKVESYDNNGKPFINQFVSEQEIGNIEKNQFSNLYRIYKNRLVQGIANEVTLSGVLLIDRALEKIDAENGTGINSEKLINLKKQNCLTEEESKELYYCLFENNPLFAENFLKKQIKKFVGEKYLHYSMGLSSNDPFILNNIFKGLWTIRKNADLGQWEILLGSKYYKMPSVQSIIDEQFSYRPDLKNYAKMFLEFESYINELDYVLESEEESIKLFYEKVI